MNRWNELVPETRGEILRKLLCKAAEISHTENSARYAPEDLGDEALIYGLCTTSNARYVAGCSVEDEALDGVSVCERGRAWWLEIQREGAPTMRIFFYKAPPGASTVHGIRLDDAEIKKELSNSNGRQLELFDRAGQPGNAELLNLIVVHYGEPPTGLEKLDVGAPYISKGEVAWDWHERFDLFESASASEPPQPLGDDGGGYPGLHLVANQATDDVAEACDAEAEPATSEFEALELLGEQAPDHSTEARTDQEQS